MKNIAAILLLFLAACAGGGGYAPPPTPPAPASWTITNGTVTVTATAGFGAAVVSVLDKNGNQYADSYDHGREFQTAYQLDGGGEGENPTEAGSAADGPGPTTSTMILGAVLNGTSTFSTVVHPAYWNVYNGAVVSPDTISKTITLGYAGLANVIRWDVKIDITEPHSTGAFEGLTGYGPVLPDTYLLQADGTFKSIGETQADGMASYASPLIESSADGTRAIGVYSPVGSYMNVMDWPGFQVNKWDCAYWVQSPLPAGSYSRTCYVAIGALADVEASILALTKM